MKNGNLKIYYSDQMCKQEGVNSFGCWNRLTERRGGWRLLQTGLLSLLCFHPFSPSLRVIAKNKNM